MLRMQRSVFRFQETSKNNNKSFTKSQNIVDCWLRTYANDEWSVGFCCLSFDFYRISANIQLFFFYCMCLSFDLCEWFSPIFLHKSKKPKIMRCEKTNRFSLRQRVESIAQIFQKRLPFSVFLKKSQKKKNKTKNVDPFPFSVFFSPVLVRLHFVGRFRLFTVI